MSSKLTLLCIAYYRVKTTDSALKNSFRLFFFDSFNFLSPTFFQSTFQAIAPMNEIYNLKHQQN